jgi:glycosyltransferase involved in cell wall biosynthesis
MTNILDIPTEYKILVEKEYYELDPKKPTIGLLMMVKNESKRLHVSLKSVIGSVDAIIIFDTGSTDNTIDIIKNFSEKNKINLYLIQGDFVNFSISRNTSLYYADKINVNYLLLLDCNDELKGGDSLKLLAKDFMSQPNNAFLVCQQWFTGVSDKYYNIRFVKNRCGWRYRGSVHEWMKDTTREGPDPAYPPVRIPDEMNIVLYQDRTQDDDKSSKRFHRDRELLLKEHLEDPTEPRIVFYLAQTCECLGNKDEALYYSKLRIDLEGFIEEIFHSYMRCGNLCVSLQHNWEDSLGWYMKAYEHSLRIEPLVKIADYYRFKAIIEDRTEVLKQHEHNKKQDLLSKELGPTYQKQPYNRKLNTFWRMSYMYIHEACDLDYPTHCILFVDKGTYDYYRWHIMGIVAFYVGKFEEGKQASLKALETGIDKVENQKILQFYLDREQHLKNESPLIDSSIKENKTQFIDRTIKELKEKNPSATIQKLHSRALAMWKKSKEKK